jgi:hypothetical protein
MDNIFISSIGIFFALSSLELSLEHLIYAC